jgi:hypothetical protein
VHEASKVSPIRRTVVVATALLASTVALAAVAMASTGDAATRWPRNASGQTYGSGLSARSPEDEPDLIRVEATNGKVGYSLRDDLEGPDPKTPEEAVRLQAARSGTSREIPVYLSDGKTEIGVFVIEDGGATY